jgi:hypothetical protein
VNSNESFLILLEAVHDENRNNSNGKVNERGGRGGRR